MDRHCDGTEHQQLLARAVDGDEIAFGELFHHYHPMIYAFAYRLSLNASDAEEIAQQTFVKAARSLSSLKGGADQFKAWLYRIARNTAYDLRRADIRREQIADGVRLVGKENAENHAADFSRVAEALVALPAAWREALMLVYYDEMNHAQAAQVLGCAEVTVSWRIFRAKRKLKALLTQHHEP